MEASGDPARRRSAPTTVALGAHRVTVTDVVGVASGARVSIDPDAAALLKRSRAVVEAAIHGPQPVYGLTTRLGAGRDTVLSADELVDFQRRVIRNHLGGIGPPLPAEEVRALTFVRLAGFTRGGSGVRPMFAEAYAALLNANVVPVVPVRGSVGAGDLTHLAAVAAVLTGTGHAFLGAEPEDHHTDGADQRGRIVTGAQALAAVGLQPVELAAGEALAALSSNAYSVGVGALAISRLALLASAADEAVALSLEAVGAHGSGGNLSPFEPAVAQATGRIGQADAAASVRALLKGSPLTDPARPVTVQDPLSFRTVPQLHGALRDQVAAARVELETELNARSDNPLVDVESARLISGGNFQIVTLALAFDSLRVALAHLASASERRISALSELSVPLRATGTNPVPGMLWYAAAADLAELRHLAAPATLAGAALSGVEDQATHAPLALQLLQRAIRLAREILAIELLHAAQLLLPAPNAAVPFPASPAPLGAGPARLLPRLHTLLERNLPAATLVDEAVRLLP